HSMSGVAIQHVLDQAPLRGRRLVGVAPVPATGLPLVESEWSLLPAAAGSRASVPVIVNYATGSRLAPGFVDLIVRHSLDNANDQAFGIYLHSWARADLLARIKGNEAPVK